MAPGVNIPPTPPAWHTLPNAPLNGAVLGRLDEMDDGQACLRQWPQADAAPAQPFRYLLTRSGATVHAFVNRCAHFGVPLAQRSEQLLFVPHQRLTCNVHYAHYDWATGRCLGGECAGEGLITIPVRVDADGTIRIHSP